MSRIIAKFHCADYDNDIWHSPPKAPFGGVVIENLCTEDELEFFLNCIKEWCKSISGKKLIIKAAPACYNPGQHYLLHRCYLSTGFNPIRTLNNHYILPDTFDFRNLVHSSERRRLTKSIAAGFTASLNRTISSKNAASFLQYCLDTNGYQLSVSRTQLENLLNQFPDDFLIFTAADEVNLIALAVTVRVNNKILYYFASGFLPEYRTFSPMVLLMESIYQYCQRNRFTIFDVGTSLDQEGQYKPSLARFKENIGGKKCDKITYEMIF